MSVAKSAIKFIFILSLFTLFGNFFWYASMQYHILFENTLEANSPRLRKTKQNNKLQFVLNTNMILERNGRENDEEKTQLYEKLVAAIEHLIGQFRSGGNDKKMKSVDPLRLTINNDTQLTNKKTVLFWQVPFGDVSMPLEYLFEKADFSSNGDELRKNGFSINSPLCGNCKFTFERHFRESADAILFHGLDVDEKDLPPKHERKPSQLYVYWSMETVPHSLALFPDFMQHSLNDFYNATMSMRRNVSDIYSPYGSISWILKLIWYKNKNIDLMETIGGAKTPSLTNNSQLQRYLNHLPTSSLTTKYENKPFQVSTEVWDLLQKKNRLAVWIASNCGWSKGNSLTRRIYMYKLTDAGLKVDVFGKCGVNFPVESRWDPAFHAIVSRYKFYFALENSYHCIDYTSEKLWINALYSGAVPVIFGPHRDDVAAVLPPKSYILVEDFADHNKLLDFLHDLDQNVTAYAEYLEWRSWVKYLDKNGEFYPEKFKNTDNLSDEKLRVLHKFAATKPIGFCALCRKLHDKQSPQSVPKLNEWIQNERSECINFPKARNMFWSSQTSKLDLIFKKIMQIF